MKNDGIKNAILKAKKFLKEIDIVVHAAGGGLGLKDAAVIAFFVTVITLVIFAVAAGDGLLGELQFMLSGFFAFFLVLWLLIAWIF